jgi:hypothetical protein
MPSRIVHVARRAIGDVHNRQFAQQIQPGARAYHFVVRMRRHYQDTGAAAASFNKRKRILLHGQSLDDNSREFATLETRSDYD